MLSHVLSAIKTWCTVLPSLVCVVARFSRMMKRVLMILSPGRNVLSFLHGLAQNYEGECHGVRDDVQSEWVGARKCKRGHYPYNFSFPGCVLDCSGSHTGGKHTEGQGKHRGSYLSAMLSFHCRAKVYFWNCTASDREGRHISAAQQGPREQADTHVAENAPPCRVGYCPAGCLQGVECALAKWMDAFSSVLVDARWQR